MAQFEALAVDGLLGYDMHMSTITLPRTKYLELKKRAAAYDLIVRVMEQELFSPPPVRSARRIISELRRTGRYRPDFLASVSKGLARSSFFSR